MSTDEKRREWAEHKALTIELGNPGQGCNSGNVWPRFAELTVDGSKTKDFNFVYTGHE